MFQLAPMLSMFDVRFVHQPNSTKYVSYQHCILDISEEIRYKCINYYLEKYDPVLTPQVTRDYSTIRE